MASRVLIPFDNNPISTTVRTASYTIPAGRYAYVVGRFLSGSSITTNVSSFTMNTLTINGTTILSNPNFRVNRPASTSGFTFPSIFTGAATFQILNNTGTSINIFLDSADLGGIPAISSSNPISVSVSGGAVFSASANHNLRIQATHNAPLICDYWVTTGTVLAGTTGTFQWEVTEYNAVS